MMPEQEEAKKAPSQGIRAVALLFTLLALMYGFQVASRASQSTVMFLWWLATFASFSLGAWVVTNPDEPKVKRFFQRQVRLAALGSLMCLSLKEKVNPGGGTLLLINGVVVVTGVLFVLGSREKLTLSHFGLALLPLFLIDMTAVDGWPYVALFATAVPGSNGN